MKNIKVKILILLVAITASCQNKKMENQTKFIYEVSVTAPEEYPVEVYLGYLSADKDFITTVPKTGVEKQGWIYYGASGMSGGSIMPNFLEVTWLSYAEKKFWKLETALPQEKMLALFRKGFTFVDSRDNDKVSHQTYNQIIIGTAPGGVVVIWLDGGLKRVEIGRYQAKEVYVDKLNFQPVKYTDQSQQEFLDTKYEILVSDTVRKKIEKEGIPFGLWDSYREKYNWRYSFSFLKKDKEKFVSITFFNGEFIILYADELDKKLFRTMALPIQSNFTFENYNCEVEFNEKEIFDAFKTLSAKYPGKNIGIEVRPAFMYKTTTFSVKCEGEEIPLEKAYVKMWKNAS